ncbi:MULTISPECIES: lipocalin-like domain-containing protein [unclassified Modicisalibacter]|uniref:lipocalin-like domain-containing protein n=1 Tax=unclassified Modicisalibacter TaxID=2679913 RepID=UPI001CCBFEE8|nr:MULTISPECIES: lipocalin-like domain-containing protein [unclassified Modicisalibacter]MBZ9557922.1 lipocalin-like domain-containing protein [Modicisalibacter sp. R2A 31.J]MBZ9573410.1 lipocalin-like domain-containing protein [Modicisalibacter sp. MOD 31.J]
MPDPVLPTPEALAGAWRLQRFIYRWPDGRERAPLGEAVGQLLYLLDEGGRPARMAVQVAARQRPPLDLGSDASLAAHFQSGFAYGGDWSLSGRAVHHDVDIASLPFWEGARLTREVTLEANRLVLATDAPSPQLPEGGYTTILEWTRDAL